MHDRRDRIEERQRVFVGQFADRVGQRRRGEGAGGDDDVAPVRRRQAVDFGAADLDQRMVVQRLGDRGRKAVAIDRQRAAGGHLVGVGRAHDQRAQPAHFGMQQADRIVGGVVGAERIGADQFGEAVGAVRLGHPVRAHLVQHHADAGIGDLPGGFRAGEAGADDMDGVRGKIGAVSWNAGVARFPAKGNRVCAAAIAEMTTLGLVLFAGRRHNNELLFNASFLPDRSGDES